MTRIFLIGFMGAGKSTVGRMLAEKLSMPFIDLDALIETREGVSIRTIFSERGEEAFRTAEVAALREACATEPAVVACGGGIVLRDENRVLMKGCGTVVYLSVSAEEAVARIGDTADRPLLAGDAAGMANTILSARLTLYRAAADHIVDTSGRLAADVVERVLGVLDRSAAVTVEVRAGAGYEVTLGAGLLDDVGRAVAESTGARSVALVTDANVDALFGDVVADSLRTQGVALHRFIIPAGESSKSWAQAGELLEGFAAAGMDRGSAVVGLGGGVVGDLAGFCASAFMRGIRLVHVPTTLLAQVDSSIGGKTGVDLVAGKNLAGSFWQPSQVVADVGVLRSLPDCEWQNGLVEVVKTALLQGTQELERLESTVDGLISRDERSVSDIVESCVRFKAAVVSDDEGESGLRECLNLGHTLGHAIEKVAGFGSVSHGVAVAEGLRFASMLTEEVFGAPVSYGKRTGSLLDALGVSRVTGRWDLDALVEAMLSDKKNRDGRIRFVLLRTPGDWEVVPVAEEVIMSVLRVWSERLQEETS